MAISDKRRAYNKKYYESHRKPKKIFKQTDDIQKIKRLRLPSYYIHNKQSKVILRAIKNHKEEAAAYQPNIVYTKKSDYRKFDDETKEMKEIGLGLFAKVDIKKNTLIQYYQMFL